MGKVYNWVYNGAHNRSTFCSLRGGKFKQDFLGVTRFNLHEGKTHQQYGSSRYHAQLQPPTVTLENMLDLFSKTYGRHSIHIFKQVNEGKLRPEGPLMVIRNIIKFHKRCLLFDSS